MLSSGSPLIRKRKDINPFALLTARSSGFSHTFVIERSKSEPRLYRIILNNAQGYDTSYTYWFDASGEFESDVSSMERKGHR
ncbi:hypothetical protein BH23VER1_BH23VER1_04460 [soil metagenome]